MCTLNASYTYSSWYWTLGLRFRVLRALGFPWFCTEEDDEDDDEGETERKHAEHKITKVSSLRRLSFLFLELREHFPFDQCPRVQEI